VGKYRELLTQSEHVGVRGVDLAIADAAVHLRARHALRTSDAIILATGLVCGADCVVTNDAAWKRVDELRVVLIDDLITTGE
jgi:predicted nucleic acid-binding protein